MAKRSAKKRRLKAALGRDWIKRCGYRLAVVNYGAAGAAIQAARKKIGGAWTIASGPTFTVEAAREVAVTIPCAELRRRVRAAQTWRAWA